METTPTTTTESAAESVAEPSTPPTMTATPRWERRLQRFCIVFGRIMLGYLFFTQIFWKLPPTFGCDPSFAFTTARPDGSLQRTKGLCDFIGVESVWATRKPRVILVGPAWWLNIRPLASANGAFIDSFVKPNIRWMGWVIFATELFIGLSLLLGLFTRLGALAAIGMSLQLMIGLAGISDPPEWEWSYNLMVVVSVMLLGLAPGRIFGLDALIRPRLQARADGGSRFARFLLLLT